MGTKQFETTLANFNQEQINQIQTAVNTVETSVNAIKNTDLALVDDQVNAIRATDLPAINTNVNSINTNVNTIRSTDLPALKVIQPTKPKSAVFLQSASVLNTYYTVVNVTSGKGILSRVSYSSNTASNEKLAIRITIDGIAVTIQTGQASGYFMYSRGWMHSASGAYGSVYAIDYLANIYFKNSLKVEVAEIMTGGGVVDATADYSIE